MVDETQTSTTTAQVHGDSAASSHIPNPPSSAVPVSSPPITEISSLNNDLHRQHTIDMPSLPNNHEPIATNAHDNYANLEALRNRLRQTFSYVMNADQIAASSGGTAETPPSDPTDAESLNQMAWRYAICPPLYFAVTAMIAICIILTLIKEVALHTGLLISLAISLLHFQDAAKFARVVAGDNGFSLFSIYAGIILRNFVNFFVAGRVEIFRVAILTRVPGGEDSFFVTMARVVLAEILVMDFVVIMKLIFHSLPRVSLGVKRRAYIWMEYTFYTYRMLIGFPQWLPYFSPPFLFTVYALFKAYFFVTRIIVWIKFGGVVMSNLTVGEDVLPEEVETETACTICQGPFKSPRKLPCKHIFCRECIRTWLDTGKEDTCPLCRSHILPPNARKFKDYDTTFPLNFF